MTAADRPSVTDNARAEAERRWPRLYGPEETLTYPREAVREHTRAGFMAGAEWAAGRAETTTDEMCGDYPAPCNCDDPETHDGAVTAADRPSVTDDARAEAAAALRATVDLDPRSDFDRGYAHGWHAAAEWAAGRAETTTATTEDAALTIRCDIFDDGTVELNEVVASNATPNRAAGLLATARTRPTRDELAKVICESRWKVTAREWRYDRISSPQRKSWLETADAVLALLADQPDPADVWDEAVEKIREQHPACEDPCEMCTEMDDWLTALADNPYRGGAR